MSDHSARRVTTSTHHTDLDDLHLFVEGLDERPDDGGPATQSERAMERRPRLAIAEPEIHIETDSVDGSGVASSVDNIIDSDPLLDPDCDGDLWLNSAGQQSDATLIPLNEMPAVSESFDLEADVDPPDHDEFLGADLSAVEDVVLTSPISTKDLIAATIVPRLVSADENIEATFPNPTHMPATEPAWSNAAPQRIGQGQLTISRLNWKPRDPFGCSDADRFRWEVMLTTACVTAVCGLGGIWLLRTILA